MTLGYFLETFLGIEKLAFGNIKGKIGIDWWPVDADRVEDSIKSQALEEPQAKKLVELWAFKENKKGFTFFHPKLREIDGNCLVLTHTRFIGGTGELIVWAMRNGMPPVIPMMQVHKLHEIAIETLSS